MTKKLKYFLLAFALITGGTLTKYYTSVMSGGIWVRKFRSTDNPVPERDIKEKFTQPMNTEGLSDVRSSGSNRPIFSDLRKRLSHVKGKIYIIDLTGGEIPYLYGKYPHDFLGYGQKNPYEFELRLRRFLVHGLGEVNPETHPQDYTTEEDAAHKNGFEYTKFFNTRRQPPTGDIIDKIIHLVETQGPEDWLHFHCYGGKGRTTVALLLVDILKNGKKLSLEEIVERQFRMGGINIFDLSIWHRAGAYTVESLTKRKMLVVHFYEYVNAPDGYGHSSWSEWAKRHNIDAMAQVD